MRNIVLLCLDSGRKDVFDDSAPRLQSLASVSFEQTRAASSWSVPSHASFMTGMLPHQHGIHCHNIDFSSINKEDIFLGSLPHTAIGMTGNTYASPNYGFGEMFDRLCYFKERARHPDGLRPTDYLDMEGFNRYLSYFLDSVKHDYTIDCIYNGIGAAIDVAGKKYSVSGLLDDGAKPTARFLKRQAKQTDDPFFFFANIMDTHLPFTPTRGYNRDLYEAPWGWTTRNTDKWEPVGKTDEYKDYLENWRDLYHASIDYVDRVLAELVEDLLEIAPNTTIIVTADHGDNLGYKSDDGRMLRHRSSLSEGLLHVPMLLINPPDGYDRYEKGYFSHTDIPLLIDGIARDEAPDVFRDKIAAELIGLCSTSPPPSESKFWNRAIRCVYDKNRKIVWDSLGNVTEYKIDFDQPCWQSEPKNATIPDWATNFFDDKINEYKQLASAQHSDNDVDEETLDRLEKLGYL